MTSPWYWFSVAVEIVATLALVGVAQAWPERLAAMVLVYLAGKVAIERVKSCREW